jgi:EmrB/QacA subfamily drug resistance transporter
LNTLTRLPCDEGVIASGAPSMACQASGQRWTLAAAILGSGMAFIDGTVVNVSLPAIQRELHATAGDMQWVVESYALFLAALLLVGGALGDRFGRRRVFAIGVGLFTAASALCGLSSSAVALIAARAVQGVGAALLVPGSLSLISAVYPQDQRGKAIGTWSAFSGITAALGPVLGGWLIERYSWTWAFWVNVPLGVLLLLMCRKVPESRSHDDNNGKAQRVDVWGACAATLGLAGLVGAFIQAPQDGWSSGVVLVALAVGIAGLVLFVWVEASTPHPMLPLALFRRRDFSGANLLTLLLYGALGGGLYYFPLNLIQVQGYGATAAGAALLPFIAIMFALSRWTGRLVDVFGPKLPLMIGPLVAALGFALFAWPSVGGSYWRTFFPAVCMLGLGMAITVAPLTTTVMNAVESDRAGVASGVNNAVSRAAGLLAIALFGILMAAVFDRQLVDALHAPVAGHTLPPELVQAVLQQRQQLAGITVPQGTDAAAADAVRQATSAAFVAGFRWVMGVCALLALLSSISAAWLIGGKAGEKSTLKNQSERSMK